MPELLACITDVYLVACKKGVTIFFFAFFRRAEPSSSLTRRAPHVVRDSRSPEKRKTDNACSAGYLFS